MAGVCKDVQHQCPGVVTAEQAEPVVDSAVPRGAQAPRRASELCQVSPPECQALGKSFLQPRDWSHTMGQSQCSVLQSLAARLSRPESGPKFSRQNKTIFLFSRKMGGLGWRTQPWRGDYHSWRHRCQVSPSLQRTGTKQHSIFPSSQWVCFCRGT